MRGGAEGNPEVRLFLAAAAALAVACSLLAAAGALGQRAAVEREIVRRNMTVLGKLAERHPELAPEAVAAFLAPATSEDAARGDAAARAYGYDGAAAAAAGATVTGPWPSVLLAAGAVLAGFAATLLPALALLVWIYRRIREVGRAAERIVDGDFSVRLPAEGEGDLAILRHHFDMMSLRLSRTLEQARGEKEYLQEFLTDVSHQLKTPLASVRLFNDLLLDGAGADARKGMELLAQSGRQIDRMEWLIRNLLSIARLEAGSVELRMERTPLDATVEDAVEGLRSAAEARGLVLQTCRAGPSAPIPHDRRWMTEALSNIVKNAVEHASSRVTVTLEETAVLARVTVEDDGPGIAAADLPHLFERFHRRSARGEGTGVGLALARAVVEGHGGIVSAESASGKGTRIAVALDRIAFRSLLTKP